MSGELDLQRLLSSFEAILVEGVYVFVTLSDNVVPANTSPRMIFQEEDGTTLILLQSEAQAVGLDYEFPSRMITLNVHSSLDAVGFIAHVAMRLAEKEMGVNPVAGFYHDHLFVPLGREQEAMNILKEIAENA